MNTTEPASPKLRLLRYLAYVFLLLLILITLLLWQTPRLVQRYLPGWLAEHYGLQLTLGEIDVGLRNPSLTLGATTLLDAKQQPIIRFEQLFITPDLQASWQQKGVVLSAVTLTNPVVQLQRLTDKKGEIRLNLTDALATLFAPAPSPEPEPASAPLLIDIASVNVTDGNVRYQDQRKESEPGWLPPLNLEKVTLKLDNLRTEANHPTAYQLSAAINGKSSLAAHGKLDVMSGMGQGKVSLKQVDLKPFAPLWAPYLKLDLAKGHANAEVEYQLKEGKQGVLWQLSKGKLTLDNWQLKKHKGDEFARFGQLALSDLAVDGQKQSLQIGKVTLQQPLLKATLNPQQELDLADLLIEQAPAKPVKEANTANEVANNAAPKSTKQAKTASNGKKNTADKPWQWQIKQIVIDKGDLTLTESSSGKPQARQLSGLKLALGPLGSKGEQPSKLTLATQFNQSSPLAFDGQLTLTPFALSGDINQQGLPLTLAQPYLADLVRIKVQNGLLSSKTRLDLATTAQGDFSKLTLQGGLDINGLKVVDRADNQRLLEFNTLALTGLTYDGISQQIRIKDIALNKPFARIEINEDGTTNLQQLLLPQPAAAKSTEAKAGSKAPDFRFTIDQLRTEQGNLRFADRSLSQDFVADIASLGGQSRHISNIPGQRSDLAFNGKVDRYAPVTIRGGTNLLVANPILDIAVAFHNLELTTFTPYSGTYAGYAIDKGQLSMKLHYKLEGNRLEGDNDITIKKLQLGEKIKSDQAKDLPLGLAIALLSDANGVIQMNLKVKGDLDQPDFSIGNIFWDVLGNTLSKAITSPFSLLASLADGTEDLDELPFLQGDPDLTPTQQEKLVKLAQALKDRPKLSMNIRGKVNFNEERPILQRQKLERVLAKLTGNQADLDLLEQDPALQEALAQAYEERFGEDLDDLADRLHLDEESAALRAQAVILLQDQQLITAKSLRNLAMRRAQNTKEFLVDSQGIAPERLFVLDSQVKEEDKEAKVILTLDQ
ncbi:DUF748 domain-containing protein [Aeromonas veronii]|uniref:DUF748 domain-containing protein n=1 Tax=Aeromonas veronii TaxID=654 RepID=UPI00187ECE16|nr:DUF748 domain-containing protein [Aeromonas veronii]MBE8733872.1 DUF748 domain-containing protein [Aeromonas veronii]MBE8738263.1 DUF748 domain-containing protein [Aeromonas veronii]MBE8741858.1 DUF748 domain-containing protein [Aeromonas veronii]MBE8763208.1 DUF748 domain-containing protein [Aeromonas veronii]MBE8837820.1 DUF748 domain-containing protein [Aeromonas veronii]